ncbi:uncharacterized protein LOC144478310 [Augochlora pura]
MASLTNLKDPEEVKEYLKNLYIEYKFGCYSEKKPEVCHLLGDYEESIKLNNEEAAKIYKRTCDTMNYDRSCTKYGDFSLVGRGCEKNGETAYKYMKRGCELNDPRGCYHAGVLAVTKDEFEKDRAKQVADGMQMLQKACDGNEERACFHLMGIYISGIKGYVEKDFKKSYQFGMKCCDFGNPYACANLSLMYKNGDGVEKNEKISDSFKERALKLLHELQTSKKQLKFHQGIDPYGVRFNIGITPIMRYYFFVHIWAFLALTLVLQLNASKHVTADEVSKKQIDVDVYYETLCPDSKRWMQRQLRELDGEIKNYIRLNFVPYGKASQYFDEQKNQWFFSCQHGPKECEGNKAHGCVIHAIKNGEPANEVQSLSESFVVCSMTTRSTVDECVKQLSISEKTKDAISSCIAGSLGDELFAENGKKTAALSPPLSFVPTIVINGVYSAENQSKGFNNFPKLICDNLQAGPKPIACAATEQ